VAAEVIAGGGGEEDDGAFEVGGFAPTAGGDAAEDFFGAHGIGLKRGGVGGAHVAGSDGVHVDAARGPLVGEGFGKLAYGAFAGGVAWNGDATEEREEGGDVDDFTGAAGEHVAAGGSAGGEDAGKVDVEHEVPVGVGVIGGRCAFNEAGVVDEDIEVALPRDGVGDEALDGGAISEIGGDGVVAGGGGERGEFGGDGGEFRGFAAVENHIGAGVGEGEGHGAAKALGGAGDEGDAAGEAEGLVEVGGHGGRRTERRRDGKMRRDGKLFRRETGPDNGEVGAGIGEVGTEGEGAFEGGDGSGEVVEVGEAVAVEEMGVGRSGEEAESFLNVGAGIEGAAGDEEDAGESEAGIGEVGFEADDGFEVGEGFG
jgi:hypothetical protein